MRECARECARENERERFEKMRENFLNCSAKIEVTEKMKKRDEGQRA